MKIGNNRNFFYQWELNQYIIDDNFNLDDEVDFSTIKTREALVVKVKLKNDMLVAEVPNILLQDYHPIHVHWIALDETGEYVQKEVSFEVKKRARPQDYVYVETEIWSYSELEQRVKILEKGGASPEAISQAVEEFLKENPIEVEIPEALPNPHKLILTGAVVAEYDGSEAITVEIPEGDNNPDIDLSEYATIKYVDEVIGSIKIPESYEEKDPTVPEWAKQPNKPTYTAEEVGAATKEYVDDAIKNIDIPTTDLTGYATEKYVNDTVKDAIDNIDIPEVDLDGYATEEYVDDAIKNIDIPKVDLTGYATEQYVNDAIENIDIPQTDLTDYATKDYVDDAIDNIDIPVTDLDGYATEQYVKDAIENSKEIHIGSDEPPENVVFQIDPEGDVVVFEPDEATEEMTQPVGLDENGKLWTISSAEWRLLDTFDLSSGALSYTADTTGCREILFVTEETIVCSGGMASWKGVGKIYDATKTVGAIGRYDNFMDGLILGTRTRDTSEPIANTKVYFGADQTNNEFKFTCSTATSGIFRIYGR